MKVFKRVEKDGLLFFTEEEPQDDILDGFRFTPIVELTETGEVALKELRKIIMIEIRHGNVLDVPTGIIVHGCNNVGVMGAGIAAEIKRRFPEAYNVYKEQHESMIRYPGSKEYTGLVRGEITYVEVAPSKFIVNAVTQGLGSKLRQVKYDAIVECFERVELLAKTIETSHGEKLDIVFPMIGAGLGGGNWNIISTIIDETIGDDFNKILYKFQP
jgi:O-acetyl-ADP-ribose deacetylase (regulator of RNase III)